MPATKPDYILQGHDFNIPGHTIKAKWIPLFGCMFSKIIKSSKIHNSINNSGVRQATQILTQNMQRSMTHKVLSSILAMVSKPQ
ncbi:unnamed protein product [Arctogadus glacialis]